MSKLILIYFHTKFIHYSNCIEINLGAKHVFLNAAKLFSYILKNLEPFSMKRFRMPHEDVLMY